MTEQFTDYAIALPSAGSDETGGQWIHILPAGSFMGRDGRGPFHARNLQNIIEESRRRAGKTQIPVDYEHQIDHARANGKPAPAAGWIKGMQARADGIWAYVEWTPRAAAHIAMREYRYISPVIIHNQKGEASYIPRVSLVQNPNLDQLKALANFEELHMKEPASSGKKDDLTPLCQLLNLPDDAGLSAIIEAVQELLTARQSSMSDPARFVPIGEFERVTRELNSSRQGVSDQAARMAVEDEIRQGRLAPFLREWGVSLCSVNKPAFDSFIERTGPATHRLFEPSGASAAPPACARGNPNDNDDIDARVAAALGHSIDAMRTGKRN